MTFTFDFLTQNKWVSIVDHLYVMFGDPSCVSFWDIVQIKQTYRQKRR